MRCINFPSLEYLRAVKSRMSPTKWSFLGLCLVGIVGSAHGADPVSIVRPDSPPVIAPATLKKPGSSGPSSEPSATQQVAAPGYLLQPGDALQIGVWNETELTAEVLIRPDGGMSFPLAGELHASGHTVAELTSMLEARIRKFEPDAVITVGVKAAAGNRVYVIGKVTRPGDFPLNRPTDVMQALSLAGGAT